MVAVPEAGTRANQELTPQSMFNQANFLFEQQKYPEAIEEYRNILKSGFTSGPLYLNLGMSYAYLDSLGMANFYFHKAREFSQTRQQAREGIDYVETVFSQRHTIIPELATFRLKHFLLFDLGYLKPILIALILFNLAALLWVATWFLRKARLLLKSSSIILLVVAVATLLTGLYVYSQKELFAYGMFVESGHVLYETPDMDSNPSFLIFEGYTFIKDVQASPPGSGWSYVQMSNGIEGWVRTRGYRLF
jgi:tetratricopeptide (TPR) repeat protein